MCRKNIHTLLLRNNGGFGLIAAVFVIVIMAMFGTLLVFYISTGKITSAEDYLWAQALYSAQSGAQLKILYEDDGGAIAGYPASLTVGGFSTAYTQTTLDAAKKMEVLRYKAYRQLEAGDISRSIEIKYILSP